MLLSIMILNLRRAIKQLQSFSIREESWLEIIPILFDVNDIDLQVLLKAYHFPGLTLIRESLRKTLLSLQ